MGSVLWLIPTLPLLSSLALMLGYRRLAPWQVVLLGVGSVALAFVVSLLVALGFHLSDPGTVFRQGLWQWIELGHFRPAFGLYLDQLSLLMTLIVTGVGCLIHLYAAGYMFRDDGYARFFAYMNLFLASMLILVLADDLLFLYVGWEGVGLCSYLLIGFWYHKPENGAAARKAFVMTRVGDTALAIGLFLIYRELHTLNIREVLSAAPEVWGADSSMPLLVGLLLLGGAVGKSAQLPLQSWLPDAMAGPTPVSALIHAATMVTAGVYLIARMQGLYLLAPDAQAVVALVGGLTLLLAGCSALTQSDIKRILAYSTISQIGYMFLALGVGAWSFAIFHLMTHAFFKALLFLSAGSVILHLHHEQDIFRMGGLWRFLTAPFLGFLVGCAALSALPLTAGFASKEPILVYAWASSPWLWLLAAGGAFLTALYSFRLFFIVFYGKLNTRPHHVRLPPFLRRAMLLVLAGLMLLSILGGALQPDLGRVLPTGRLHGSPLLELVNSLLPWAGVLLAYQLYYRRIPAPERLGQLPGSDRLAGFWQGGWGFDSLYGHLILRPFTALCEWNRQDVADWISKGAEHGSRYGHNLLQALQNGETRWYAAVMAAGLVLLTGMGALL